MRRRHGTIVLLGLVIAAVLPIVVDAQAPTTSQTPPTPSAQPSPTFSFRDPQTLLTAVGVVLAVVTIIIGIASIIGVAGVPLMIRQMVKAEIEQTREGLRREMEVVAVRKGQLVAAGVYLNYGVLAARVGRWAFHGADADQTHYRSIFFDESISFIEQALRSYLEIEPTHENVPRAKNNLAFYLSLRRRAGDGPRARDLSREILQGYRERGDLECLNTCAGIAHAFPDLHQRTELEWFLSEVVQRIIHEPTASDWHRRNAIHHREELQRILEARQ